MLSLQQQRQQQRREALNWWAEGTRFNLRWLVDWFRTGGWSVLAFQAVVAAGFLSTGAFLGVNLPPVIGCWREEDVCYRLRWDKSRVKLHQPPKSATQSTGQERR